LVPLALQELDKANNDSNLSPKTIRWFSQIPTDEEVIRPQRDKEEDSCDDKPGNIYFSNFRQKEGEYL